MKRAPAALLALSTAAAQPACHSQEVSVPARLLLKGTEPAGPFARAWAPRDFSLPADHGPHHEFQTEWWYYTGNLEAPDGRRFGYQLTFFRRGLTPGAPPASGLATNQVYFAHFAVTDAGRGTHSFAERFSRGALGLAGAEGDPFRVFLEDWGVEATTADGGAAHLRAREGDLSLDLRLESQKPLVQHGDRGLSPKSGDPGNASFYIGYTRLATRGTLALAGEAVPVAGESWFDHEWSTSALGSGAVGWDWFSLQLSDDREVMFFVIRRADGTIESVSGGTLVETDGRTRRLAAAEVTVTVREHWTSAKSGGVYPSRWTLAIPGLDLELDVLPLLAGQEMLTSFQYWEGAVRLTGRSRGLLVTGRGYVELTGYASSMQGVF